MIAFIPARGGSERVPNKNLQEVGGKTLIERAVDVARAIGAKPIVSTESQQVKWHCESINCEVTDRPFELAKDDSQIEEAILHWLGYTSVSDGEVILLLQPTSPFRSAQSTRLCGELVQKGLCRSALTALKDHRRSIFWGVSTSAGVLWERNMTQRPRSQDVNDVVVESGGCYAFTAGFIRQTGSRMGDHCRVVEVGWREAFEVDTSEDLAMARWLNDIHAEYAVPVPERTDTSSR